MQNVNVEQVNGWTAYKYAERVLLLCSVSRLQTHAQHRHADTKLQLAVVD